MARVGAAADTFGGMHSDLPEPERPDRGRLAEDLCDVLIQMVRRGCWYGWGVRGSAADAYWAAGRRSAHAHGDSLITSAGARGYS